MSERGTLNYATPACRSRHHARINDHKRTPSMELWGNPFEALDDIIERQAELGADVAVKLEVETECCWSCELRWTQRPNDHDAPDRSIVFYAGGGALPDHPLAECILALEQELAQMASEA
jgi:hypothetical protein